MKFRQGFMGRSALAVAMAGVLLAAPTMAAAQTIIVEGNKRVDSETIRSYFIGANPNDAVKKLYQTGYFSDVEVSHRGGALVVRVVENTKLINHVVFVGNSKVKTAELDKVVMSKSHGAYSPATVAADVQRILDIYRRSGHNAAKVTTRIVNTPNGRVDVVFNIDEGEKTGVKEIRFIGNHVYSDSKLLGLMSTTEMNFLSFFKTSDVYDPERIAKDAETIRRYYLKNGYADFRILGTDAVYDAAKGGYIVTISMQEGEKYTVSSVNVVSHLAGVTPASVESFVDIHKGDTYNGDDVQKTVTAITTDLSNRGFAFNQVTPRGQRDPATHTVALAFDIDEGPHVYIERINISGNTATRDYVIRREFDIGEGDAYNKALIDKAERRLNALGFFKSVKITNEAGDRPDEVIVDVNVVEKSTGNFSVSGGYSTQQGWLASVSVSQSNFLGRGEYIRGSVTYGQYAKGVELNYTEPFFLDQRLAAGFDLYSKLSNASPYAYYEDWVTGGTLRLGVPLNDEITLSPRYTGYFSRLTIPNSKSMPYNDCSNPIPGFTPYPGSATSSCLTNGEASVALKQAAGDWVTSMVGYTLNYNDLDNPRNPEDGIYASLKQDFAGVGGDSEFLRTTGDLRYYHPLYLDGVVGIVHLQAGDMFGWGGQQLRIVDNFNLGPTLVRGFAPGGLGPRDITNPGVNNWGNSLGGTQFVGASVEADFPIWGIPRDIGLRGAVFADAGTLFDYAGATNFTGYMPNFPYGSVGSGVTAGNACTPANKQATIDYANAHYTQSPCIKVEDSAMIRSSVGLGVIWNSPMGPIRVNYAFVLSKDKYDVTQAFSFSGGTSF